MFVITQSDSYLWPVKVETPVDGGKWSTETFDARFKRLPQSRIEEVRKNAATTEDDAFAREVLVGWEGINDADGQAVPYSEVTRDRLLDVIGFAKVVVAAYFESLTGAKRKN